MTGRGGLTRIICAMLCWALMCQGVGLAESLNGDLTYHVARIRVHVRDGNGTAGDLAALARNMIVLREGATFEARDLEASLAALKQSRLFETIHIADPDFSQPNLVFDVYLKPVRRIRDVRIHNAFPLMAKRVKSAMRLYAGDPFIDQPLREKEERVRDLYRKSGYLDPGVTITAEEPVPGEGVMVSVWIDKGEYMTIDRVRITGNDSFSEFRLKLRTDSYKASFLVGDGRRFIKATLDQDIKNLIRFYRERGYADVSITAARDIVDKDQGATIHLIVVEGPRYRIRFEGNHEFWDRTLRKDIDLIRRGNVGDMALKRGVRTIRDRYRQAGYPDVYVSMRSETDIKDGQPQRQVVMTIDEGPRSLVSHLEIKGNSHIGDEQLKKQILTLPEGLIRDGAYVADTLADDLSSMKAVYKINGFLNAEIGADSIWEKDEKGNRRTRLTVRVDEGVQTRVASIRFTGLTAFSNAEALGLLGLVPGDVFSQNRLKEDEQALVAAIAEKGYPLVTVLGQVHIAEDGKAADLVFEVNQGPFLVTGKTVIQGHFRTKKRVIEREMELVEGEPFSLAKWLESQRNIRNIRAFSGSRFREFGLKEQRERVDLLIEAEEKKPYYAQLALGYDTRRHGYLNGRLGDHNLFGLNKDAWIGAEYSEIGYRVESGVTEPRFLDTRIVSTLNLFSEKLEELNKDFGTRTHGVSLSFNRDFLSHFNAALAFRYEYRDQYQRDDDLLPEEDMDFYEGRRMVVTSPSISYNSTDSFIRSRKGLHASLAVDLSKALGDAPDEFLKYHVQARYYHSPLERFTLAFRLRYGYIQPREGTVLIPDDQLFFLGGTADVRGFDENMLRYDHSRDPEGGRELIMGGIEVRTELSQRWELTTFFDTGRIGKTFSKEGTKQFRSSAGAGLRYITPIGPVGFLYGVKIDPDASEDFGQFHFTLGYSF